MEDFLLNLTSPESLGGKGKALDIMIRKENEYLQKIRNTYRDLKNPEKTLKNICGYFQLIFLDGHGS